jgi:NitT/TauT family transport system ATP-binding protein
LSLAPAVELDGVRVDFGPHRALEGVSLAVSRGSFTAVVGPTGCGKSSLLNLVAGLLAPTAGRVRCAGRPVDGVNPDAAYMFQHDALFPWKDALENVALGPLLRGVPRPEALDQAGSWLDRVGLRSFERRYPHQLSGGERKRVAMAQSLINGLPLLLMDEPFSALDAQTRALMETELLELSQGSGATVHFVTHDLEEAVALADRVVLLTAGPGARIKGDYPVALPRPRDVMEARFTPGFTAVYTRIWSDLKAEVLAGNERRKAR